MQRMLQGRRKTFILIVSTVILLSGALFFGINSRAPQNAHAENNGVGQKPFMGWSSWYFVGRNPTQANIEAQAQAVSTHLKSHGYNYILLDDFYYLNPSTNVDQYGRWVTDTTRFPSGLAGVASYVHGLGLKFGAYLTPGIPVAAVNQNTAIQGTSYHARDIADTSRHETNYNYGGNVMYYIDYSKPGAQAYINSWANLLASWGVDFLKIDGVGTYDIPDIQAWSQGLQQTGRPILFDLSNSLSVSQGDTWRQYANSWRISGDVQCYCSTQVTWNSFSSRFSQAPAWLQFAGTGAWNDLDSLNVANGSIDGISNDERQTYMTLWAIESAPLNAADDLTNIDSYGLSLLTNDEVIAVDQAGHPAHPVSQSSNQQVWWANNGDGSYTVALFNLGGSSSNVTANWSDLGITGAASVHDLWSHSDLGSFSGNFGATLNSHASRLLKVTPSGGGLTCGSFSGYYKIVNRNSGSNLDVHQDSTDNKANIVQYANNNQADQQWFFQDAGGGYCKIVNRNSGKLLNIPGPTMTQNTQLIQYYDDGNNNAQWSLTSVGGGYYNIVSRYDGQDVDVQGASTANEAPVIQWPKNTGSNQQWQFVTA